MPATTSRTRAAARRALASPDPQADARSVGATMGRARPSGRTRLADAASRFGQQIEVFRDGRRCEIRTDERSPFLECRRLAEIDGVILHGIPVDHQQVALGRLDPLVHLVASITFRFRNAGFDAALHRRIEIGLPAWLDAEL